MRRVLITGLLLLLTAWLAPSSPAYEVIEVKDGGAIAGRVTFVGEVPDLEPIPVPKDQEFCGKTIPSNVLIVSGNKGVKNAIVFLERVAKGKRPVVQEPLLDNNRCVMVPLVQAILVGADLNIRNSDPLLHDVRTRLDGKPFFNLALPIQGQTIKRRIRKAGLMTVSCDAHPHMRGYIHVFEHPYFAVTDGEGTFRIEDVPPGKYVLKVWHAGWKVTGKDRDGRLIYEEPHVLSKEVTVLEKQEAKVNFELRPR